MFSVQLASRGPKGELTGQSVSSDYQLDLQLDVNANGMVDLSVQELPHLKAAIARNLDLRVDKTLTDAFDRFRLAFHSPHLRPVLFSCFCVVDILFVFVA